MKLIVGLGNPGEKYTNNRHNIGFEVVREISHHFSFSPWSEKFLGFISNGTINGEKVILLMPMTFMNKSGFSVSKAVQFYKIPPEDIIIYHDEIDLEPLKIKVKQGGGSAGHNGLKSVTTQLGSNEYHRVRIGVGRPEHGEVSNYVLSNFSKDEIPQFKKLIQQLVDKTPYILAGDMAKALHFS